MTCGSCTFGKYMCLLPKCLGHRCHLGSQTVSISPLSEMPLESCRKQRIMMPTCQCFAGQVVGDGKEKIVVQNCWRRIVCLAFFHVFFISLLLVLKSGFASNPNVLVGRCKYVVLTTLLLSPNFYAFLFNF